jgi:hypothetical protein
MVMYERGIEVESLAAREGKSWGHKSKTGPFDTISLPRLVGKEIRMEVKRRYHRISLVMFVALTLLISGCVGVRIRASDSMLQENSIKKIAILATGRVEWPRMGWGRKEPILGLTESKKALETVVSHTKSVLSSKGYEIIFSEPAGIGYYNPFYKENWVYENYGEKGEEARKWQVTERKPAYEYPVVENNQEFCRAIRNVFEQMELAIYGHTVYSFILSKDDLDIIRQVTGADTICFSRVYGQKFSRGRKIAVAAIAAALGSSATAEDSQETAYFFVDARTGDILWQYWTYLMGKDPMFSVETMDIALKYFPEINKTMNPKCKKKNPVGPIYDCPR